MYCYKKNYIDKKNYMIYDRKDYLLVYFKYFEKLKN